MEEISQILANELGMTEEHVKNVINLMDEGSTIPFVARYRKEAHGSADDTTLRKLEERLKYLRSLEERRQEIIKSIDNQEKLTPELTEAIQNARTLSELEDIYRPYKQKSRTRASIAKEQGLEPLADKIMLQLGNKTPGELAKDFVTDEVPTIEDALQGASDIIAEQLSD